MWRRLATEYSPNELRIYVSPEDIQRYERSFDDFMEDLIEHKIVLDTLMSSDEATRTQMIRENYPNLVQSTCIFSFHAEDLNHLHHIMLEHDIVQAIDSDA